LKNAALQLFFPQTHCAACGDALCEHLICADCLSRMEKLRRCPRCGSFLHKTSLYCETCSFIKKPYFDRVVSALPYEGALKMNIRRMKYGKKTYYRRPFAELLCELLAQEYADISFDLLLPVPVSEDKLKSRGYNQVDLFAKPAAQMLGLPYNSDALFLIKDIPSLVGKTRRERFELANNAFGADKEQVEGKTVLLIDDVFTTGATSQSCSKALKKAGAKAVYVATLAGHFTIN